MIIGEQSSKRLSNVQTVCLRWTVLSDLEIPVLFHITRTLYIPFQPVSLPELLRSHGHKLQLMQVHLEAERERGRLKEEVLQDLRTDKLHLQQEVTRMEALIQDLWKDKVKKSSITGDPPNLLGDLTFDIS